MKKILFVVDERMMGGVSVILENIINSFKNINFDILVLHDRGNELNNLNNAKLIFGTPFFEVADLKMSEIIKSMNIKLFFKKLYLVFCLKSGLIKNKIIKERKKIFDNDNYDLEICFKDGIGTYFVAYGNSKEKVRWLHNDYSTNNPGSKYMKTYTDAINKFDKIIAISKYIGINFNKIFKRDKDTFVIYNIIDTTKYDNKKTKKKNSDVFEFGTVGRLAYVKGYDRVINAINRLNNEGLFENAIFKIVGSGEEETNLKNLVKQYKLEDKIIFLGRSNTPWDLIKDIDIFVMSSRFEAYPTTVIESLLNKVPVFSVEYVSSPETLNESNSIVVRNNDEDIYNGIKKILLNKEIVYKLQENVLSYKYTNNEDSIEKLKKLFE